MTGEAQTEFDSCRPTAFPYGSLFANRSFKTASEAAQHLRYTGPEMGAKLQDRIALITGAGGGIGSEIARLFASEGARIVVCDIRREHGERTVAQIANGGGKAIFAEADVSDAKAVDRMFRLIRENFGRLDVLVNCVVHLGRDTTISDLDEKSFDETIAVCLKGPFLCTREAVRMMADVGGGSIVTISSVNALFGFGHTAYTAAKGGLVSMMRLVAAEYGHLNIRSNIICPATIETEISMKTWGANPEGYKKLMEMYPLGRIGSPRDVANCSLFLASEDAAFVTGAVYVVDGGLLAGRKFDF